MMYLDSEKRIVGPLVEELEGRRLLSSAPAMTLTPDSDPVRAAAQSISLAGAFGGEAHVGQASAGLLGTSGTRSVVATLTLAEDANGLITGSLTFGPATSFTSETFSLQGTAKGRDFDAAIWQGAVGSSATSAGRFEGTSTPAARS